MDHAYVNVLNNGKLIQISIQETRIKSKLQSHTDEIVKKIYLMKGNIMLCYVIFIVY